LSDGCAGDAFVTAQGIDKVRKAQLTLLLIVASGLVVGLRFSAVSSPVASPTPAARIPVGVSAVARQDVPVYLLGLGNVQAYNSVTVRAQIDGQITEVAFKEGQEVKAGDILVRIDPRTYHASLDQAVAKNAQDQALLDNARRDLQRHAALVEKNLVARQQYDTTKSQVAQLEAAVKGDEALVEYAEVNLGYATIRSPLNGRAGMRRIDSGNVVRANDANGIVTITQTRPISLIFTLPEGRLQDIVKEMSSGPLAVAAVSRDAQQKFDTGEVSMIDNAIDQTTGTIRLKAVFPNEAGLLWPGQFVTAQLRLSTLRDVLTIPAAAVQNGPDGRFAYLVKDGVSEVRKLRLAQVDSESAVVEAGLDAGDLVVVSGQYRLQPGLRVTVEEGGPAKPVVANRRE
jgi:multidrug efflux system membrane fusion protein